ncbi:TPM domain-containing protein [Pseudaminobacter soli (ex Zhang et al. 2022)]|nr:TPM domain-containing protein [Pseudaminobacter soli]
MTPDDHQRIAATIRAAEAKTSGEIFCVVARRSDGYFYPAAFFVALFTMAAALIAAFVLEYLWISVRLPIFVSAVVSALATAWLLLLLLPQARILFVPHRHRHRRAHENAMRQFLARNIHLTSARTGVLIFASLAEHYAVVIADSGINAKVPQETWNEIVGDLVRKAGEGRLPEGLGAAVDKVGGLLSLHFPRGAGDVNELDDHVVEI